MTNKIEVKKASTVDGNLKKEYLKIWKKARIGIFIFCGLHFIFEAFMENKAAVFFIWINYIISSWIIKNRIGNRKMNSNPTATGFIISLFVFIVRLLLGFIVMFIINLK